MVVVDSPDSMVALFDTPDLYHLMSIGQDELGSPTDWLTCRDRAVSVDNSALSQSVTYSVSPPHEELTG